jgi:hypothetical protein
MECFFVVVYAIVWVVVVVYDIVWVVVPVVFEKGKRS